MLTANYDIEAMCISAPHNTQHTMIQSKLMSTLPTFFGSMFLTYENEKRAMPIQSSDTILLETEQVTKVNSNASYQQKHILTSIRNGQRLRVRPMGAAI